MIGSLKARHSSCILEKGPVCGINGPGLLGPAFTQFIQGGKVRWSTWMKQTIIPGPPRPASQFTWNWLCCFKSQACKDKTIWMTKKHGWKMKANNADYINIVSFRCQDYIYTLTNQRWTNMKTHSACLDPVTAWRAAFEIDPWTYFWEMTFLDVSLQWLSCLNLAGFQSKSNLYVRKLPSSKVKDLENYDKKKWNSNIGSSNLDLNDGSGERHPQSLLFSSLEIPLVACEQRTSKNNYDKFRLVFFSDVFFISLVASSAVGPPDHGWACTGRSILLDPAASTRWPWKMAGCGGCGRDGCCHVCAVLPIDIRSCCLGNWGETMLKFVKVNIF